MNQNIISRITDHFEKLSKSHKAIARFVLEHFDKAAYMNVEQLSRVTGVSEATVVRFSSELGYEKYQQFQHAVWEYAKSKLTSVQRIELTYGRLDTDNILSNVLHADIDKIRTTLSGIDQQEFNSIVNVISNARRIYIVGLRSASYLAGLLGFYLNLIFDQVIVVSSVSASEIFEQLYRINEEDVVIGISFPRYSKRTINALRYAKAKGVTVVGITDGAFSPIKVNADYALLARSDMESFVDSLVAPLSVINALIVALAARKKDDLRNNFETLEHIWHDYDVYDTVDDNVDSLYTTKQTEK
ncbi:MAG: MurR/RpiR family transcriptional regulator [Ruminococcaceae bacterium]|nr:MurR/RpiR family transcriptional regulator [Oscillospiraceae bacterium]